MSMIMVRSGHVALARSIINEDFTLAWGSLSAGYADPWTQGQTPPASNSKITTVTLTKGATNGSDATTLTDIIKIVSVKQGAVTYIQGTDYTLDGTQINWSMTASGAKEPTGGTTYQVVARVYSDDVNALLNEIGRRKPASKAYVIKDPNGDIQANNFKWSQVNYPTENIFLSFRFNDDEGIGSSIYQIGVFIGAVFNSGLPAGQMYFTPAQLQDPGSLYLLENYEPFPRNTGTRPSFEIVITL